MRNSLYLDTAPATWPKSNEDTKVINYVNLTYQEASAPARSAIEIRRETDGAGYLNTGPVALTDEIGGRLGYFANCAPPMPRARPSTRCRRITRAGCTSAARAPK